MKCKICNNNMDFYMSAIIMNKYDATYYYCPTCKSIQIESPTWLEEAYSNPALELRLDSGRFARSKYNANFIDDFINKNLDKTKEFIDFGCGPEELLVKNLRNKGYKFWSYDKYHTETDFFKNINSIKYEAISAFEVFEHIEYPVQQIKELLDYTNTIIIGTDMIKDKQPLPTKDWRYFSFLAGQHITFYSQDSFRWITKHLNLKYNFYNLDSKFGNIVVFSK